MRRVINSKLYDTDKALLLHEWEPFADPSNFDYIYEALYLTHKGEFFIAGHGGPTTGYSTSLGGGSSTGGEAIRPVDKHGAMSWLERHHGTEALLVHFDNEITDA